MCCTFSDEESMSWFQVVETSLSSELDRTGVIPGGGAGRILFGADFPRHLPFVPMSYGGYLTVEEAGWVLVLAHKFVLNPHLA